MVNCSCCWYVSKVQHKRPAGTEISVKLSVVFTGVRISKLVRCIDMDDSSEAAMHHTPRWFYACICKNCRGAVFRFVRRYCTAFLHGKSFEYFQGSVASVSSKNLTFILSVFVVIDLPVNFGHRFLDAVLAIFPHHIRTVISVLRSSLRYIISSEPTA